MDDQIIDKGEGDLALKLSALDPLHIVVHDADGIIKNWSTGSGRLFGWSAAEAVGNTLSEILAPEETLSIPEIDAVIRMYGRWKGNVVYRHRDGHPISVLSRRLHLPRDTG